MLPGGEGEGQCQHGPVCGLSQSKAAQESYKTNYKEKTHCKAPKKFILEDSGQPTGRVGVGVREENS